LKTICESVEFQYFVSQNNIKNQFRNWESKKTKLKNEATYIKTHKTISNLYT